VKIAVEAIKGVRTTNQIASAYGIHPSLVIRWKLQALTELPRLLSDGCSRAERAEDQLREQFYSRIGELTCELDWIKRSWIGPLSRSLHGSRQTTRRSAAGGNASCWGMDARVTKRPSPERRGLFSK
jgi:hypothetical protein